MILEKLSLPRPKVGIGPERYTTLSQLMAISIKCWKFDCVSMDRRQDVSLQPTCRTIFFTVKGREETTPGNFSMTSVVVAPGKQWVIVLGLLMCFTMLSPIIATVGLLNGLVGRVVGTVGLGLGLERSGRLLPATVLLCADLFGAAFSM